MMNKSVSQFSVFSFRNLVFRFSVYLSERQTTDRLESDNRQPRTDNRLGFTLIELLVVIAILGILATIALVAIRGAQASARDAQRKSDLADLRSTLEIIRADCGKYPTTIPFAQTTNWDISYNATTCPNLTSGTTNTYMSKVPQDPQVNRGGATYQYVFDSVNNRYSLCSYLEHPGSASGGQCGSGGTCGTQSCYYTLTNP